jgi:hypothetical protein
LSQLTKNRLVALGQTVVDYAGMKPRCQELFANFSQSQHPQAFQTLPKTSWEGEWNDNGSSRERSYPAFKSTISPLLSVWFISFGVAGLRLPERSAR